MAKRIFPGDQLDGIDAVSWNEFADAAEYVKSIVNRPQEADQSTAFNSPGVAKVVLFEETDPFQVVGLDSAPFVVDDETVYITRPVIQTAALNATTHANRFAITQQGGKVGQAVPAVAIGFTWCKVDIQDASDTTAGVISADATKLESGKPGCEIIAKELAGEETETGVQWCLVKLGSGGKQQTLKGTVAVTASIGAAFIQVTPSSRFAGVTPTPVKVLNANTSEERTMGETIYAIRGTTAVTAGGSPVEWVELEASGGGGGDHPHFVALLDADLATEDLTASLTGAAEDYDWADGVPLATLPTSVSNPHGLVGIAADRVLVLPNLAAAWMDDVDYTIGQKVYATQPGSSPAETHLYKAANNHTSEGPFDAGEVTDHWTDLGEYQHTDWIAAGVFLDNTPTEILFAGTTTSTVTPTTLKFQATLTKSYGDAPVPAGAQWISNPLGLPFLNTGVVRVARLQTPVDVGGTECLYEVVEPQGLTRVTAADRADYLANQFTDLGAAPSPSEYSKVKVSVDDVASGSQKLELWAESSDSTWKYVKIGNPAAMGDPGIDLEPNSSCLWDGRLADYSASGSACDNNHYSTNATSIWITLEDHEPARVGDNPVLPLHYRTIGRYAGEVTHSADTRPLYVIREIESINPVGGIQLLFFDEDNYPPGGRGVGDRPVGESTELTDRAGIAYAKLASVGRDGWLAIDDESYVKVLNVSLQAITLPTGYNTDPENDPDILADGLFYWGQLLYAPEDEMDEAVYSLLAPMQPQGYDGYDHANEQVVTKSAGNGVSWAGDGDGTGSATPIDQWLDKTTIDVVTEGVCVDGSIVLTTEEIIVFGS